MRRAQRSNKNELPNRRDLAILDLSSHSCLHINELGLGINLLNASVVKCINVDVVTFVLVFPFIIFRIFVQLIVLLRCLLVVLCFFDILHGAWQMSASSLAKSSAMYQQQHMGGDGGDRG
eukprot:IDg8928t1